MRIRWAEAAALFLLASLGGLAVYEWAQFDLDRLPDDVLISLVYAQNIAAGDGFSFNPGEPSLGTTSPLWAAVIAALAWLAGVEDVRGIAVTLYMICFVAGSWVFLLLRKSFGLSFIEAALVGVATYFCTRLHLIGGEMPAFHLLLTICLATLLSRRWLLGGLLIPVVFLTRGEGLLLYPIAGIVLLCFHWRDLISRNPKPLLLDALKLGVPSALVFAAWAAYAELTFGMILPNTLVAKMSQGVNWIEFNYGELFWHGLLETLGEWNSFSQLPNLVPQVLVYALILIGICVAIAGRRRMLVFALWGVLFTAGYSQLGLPSIYTWYRVSPLWSLSVFLGLGLAWILVTTLRSHRQRRVKVAAAVLLVLAVLSVRAQSAAQDFRRVGPADLRAKYYLPACDWLNTNAEPGANIACAEIGYVGYFTPMNVIDLCGLTNRRVLRLGGLTNLNGVLNYYEADYYMTWQGADCEMRDGFDTGDFRYEFAATFETWDPGKCIHIYKRLDPGPG